MTNKLSDKDKKDWKNFINSSEKLDNKDIDNLDQLNVSEKIIDLHGYSLDEANKKIENFIESCYSKKIKKINVITGKGMRSKNLEDPYQSIDMSILKYSVPEYIKNNNEFVSKREEILSMIWDMEEEIMGKDN